MQFRKVDIILRPARQPEPQRVRIVVNLAVVGFASTLSVWLANLESAGPAWVDTTSNVLFLAAALGFGLASYLISSYWLVMLSFRQTRGAFILLMMSLVMNTILLDAAVNRTEDYQNMAAGILAALIIAVVTTQPKHALVSGSSEE